MLERLAGPTVEQMQPRGAQEPKVNQRQAEVPFVMDDCDVNPLLEPQAPQSEKAWDAAIRLHEVQIAERPPIAAEPNLSVNDCPFRGFLQSGNNVLSFI